MLFNLKRFGYFDIRITQKYLNIFSETDFKKKLTEKLNGKATPKIYLKLELETNEENIIESAKITWHFDEEEYYYMKNDEIFFYNRDKSQGRIDKYITECVDECFNNLALNDLLLKLIKEVPILNKSIEVIN